VKENKTQIVLR